MKTLDAGASGHGFTVKKPAEQKVQWRASRKYMFAIFMLTIATLFWGFGNVAQKIALSDVSPSMVLFIRSAIALFCLVPLAIVECKNSSIGFDQIWKHRGLLLVTSFSFASGLALQTFGGQLTSATNLGFLVNLCVLITPLLLFAVYGERVSRLTLVSCIICFGGAALLTGLNFQEPNLGDLMCVAGAIAYAVWIIALDRTLKVFDAPVMITLLQFWPTFILGFMIASPHGEVFALDYAKLWPSLVFVSVLSTCIGFLIASYAQRLVKPVVAGLIYSFEALFGAIGAYVVLGEQLSIAAMTGGGLMFASILICQLRACSNHAPKPVQGPEIIHQRVPRTSLVA